jgi:hypothetical protein
MHRIKMLTGRSTTNLSLDQLIHALNPILGDRCRLRLMLMVDGESFV